MQAVAAKVTIGSRDKRRDVRRDDIGDERVVSSEERRGRRRVCQRAQQLQLRGHHSLVCISARRKVWQGSM